MTISGKVQIDFRNNSDKSVVAKDLKNTCHKCQACLTVSVSTSNSVPHDLRKMKGRVNENVRTFLKFVRTHSYFYIDVFLIASSSITDFLTDAFATSLTFFRKVLQSLRSQCQYSPPADFWATQAYA